jgi:hypothetical protein
VTVVKLKAENRQGELGNGSLHTYSWKICQIDTLKCIVGGLEMVVMNNQWVQSWKKYL